MSPFRRRKGSSTKARTRRRELVERERRRYERESAGAEAPPEARAEDAEARQPRTPALRGRRSRRARRRAGRPSLGGLRSASVGGARATVRQARPGVGRLLGALGAVLGWLLAWPLRLAGLIETAVTGLTHGLLAAWDQTLDLAERHLTLERVLVLVTAVAAGCLVYSQFVAYRGVEVGQPQYSQVSAIAPAPQTDRIDAGAAHAYVLIPLAALALAAAVIALATGRWRLGRLVSVIGLAGIAISLAIDLPKGLDAGSAGNAFAGANATLTEGFYAQLSASAVLVLCGWLLAVNLRGSAAAREGRGLQRSRPKPQRTAVAGGGA